MSEEPESWVATLNGDSLPSCRWYDEVVSSGQVPKESPWARSVVWPSLKSVKRADSIWEAILAIWRLRVFEESGREDVVWKKHLRAWIVRISFLVSLFHS